MRFGYIIDHPKRDLSGGILLAKALGLRGAETVLIPLYQQGLDVPYLNLDGIIVNFARPINFNLVRNYVEVGIPVWVMDTEGGVLTKSGANSPEALSSYINLSGFRNLLAGYFFWGVEIFNAFKLSSGMLHSNLHVTGCPRFDWASIRWRKLLSAANKDFTLINTNFSLVNPLFADSAETEVDNLVAAGWERSYVDELVENQRAIFLGYISTLKNLFESRPSCNFILRPHPFESSEFYKKVFIKYHNVTVFCEGSVLDMINSANAVIHLNCGTAVECVLLETLPISLEFLNTEFMRCHVPLPSRVSFKVNNFEELLQTIDALPEANLRFPFERLHREFIEPWFYVNDGYSSERMADILVSYIKGDGKIDKKVSGSKGIGWFYRKSSLMQLFQIIISSFIGSRNVAILRSSLQKSRRDKLIQIEVIKDLLDQVNELNDKTGMKANWVRHPITHLKLASILIKS
jgi:surface carbohydrate biosynthesis protein